MENVCVMKKEENEGANKQREGGPSIFIPHFLTTCTSQRAVEQQQSDLSLTHIVLLLLLLLLLSSRAREIGDIDDGRSE
jgi:hypothetical protein